MWVGYHLYKRAAVDTLVIGRACDTHHPVIIPLFASHPIRPPSVAIAICIAIPIGIGNHGVRDVSAVDSALYVSDACGDMAISATT